MTSETTDSKQTNKTHHQLPLFLHHGWYDFYPSHVTQPSTENTSFFNNLRYENLDSHAIKGSESDLYVVNCYFYSITYSGNGAAIYLYQKDVHFLVEYCTFFECSAKGSGGGLYIGYADVEISHVCAIECNSSYTSSFCHVHEAGRTINSVNFTSVSYCFSTFYYAMYHNYGHINVQSVNLSYNKGTERTTLGLTPSLKKDRFGTEVCYSTFAYNNASSYCMYLNYDQSANELLIDNSNFIRNLGEGIILLWQGDLTVTNTCIMDNINMTNLFKFDQYQDHGIGTCTLINCSLDNKDKLGIGTFNTSFIGTNSFTNELPLINTNCVMKFESPEPTQAYPIDFLRKINRMIM